jgi:adenylate cyclase
LRTRSSGKKARLIGVGMASAVGAMLVGALGWLLVAGSLDAGAVERRERARSAWIGSSFAEALARVSYDLPFVIRDTFRDDQAPTDASLIYIDDSSARALDQRVDAWDRRLHAQLVRKLTHLGARAIFFDIVFSEPWPDPAVDEDFAAAMRENGHVFLGAALELEEGIGGPVNGDRVTQQRTIAPIPILRRAAAGWGLLAFRPVDPDYSVRSIYTGMETIPSATWLAAKALGAGLPDAFEERSRVRWMNYYGRADVIPSVSYTRALAPGEPSDLFRDRIVVIGGRSTLGGLHLGKDDFRGPYGLLGGQVFKGPEIHLTALLNLLHGEWLTRMSGTKELILAVVLGILLGGGLPWTRPHVAVLIALGSVLAVAGLAYGLFAADRVWFAWGIPVIVQAPVALVWAVGSRYFIEERRQRALRDAFAHYLSPQLADRIADSDFDLSLGGVVIEATVMFTDLENFTTLSEELDDPARISKILTTYFTQTTDHILKNDGTILKYLGDSVQAVWGAPLPDEHQARNAVRSALLLHEAGQMEVLGHPLKTRIGINTGRVLAGNLGSEQRFDYATTGDAVNFASRLEGLNKYLGTNILISDTVAAQLGPEFVLRCAGEFRVVGKKSARVIHEVIGEGIEPPPWLATFARALEAFRQQDFDRAGEAFRETSAQRGREDGPSTFYLAQVARLRSQSSSSLPPEWHGVVELSAK